MQLTKAAIRHEEDGKRNGLMQQRMAIEGWAPSDRNTKGLE